MFPLLLAKVVQPRSLPMWVSIVSLSQQFFFTFPNNNFLHFNFYINDHKMLVCWTNNALSHHLSVLQIPYTDFASEFSNGFSQQWLSEKLHTAHRHLSTWSRLNPHHDGNLFLPHLHVHLFAVFPYKQCFIKDAVVGLWTITLSPVISVGAVKSILETTSFSNNIPT